MKEVTGGQSTTNKNEIESYKYMAAIFISKVNVLKDTIDQEYANRYNHSMVPGFSKSKIETASNKPQILNEKGCRTNSDELRYPPSMRARRIIDVACGDGALEEYQLENQRLTKSLSLSVIADDSTVLDILVVNLRSRELDLCPTIVIFFFYIDNLFFIEADLRNNGLHHASLFFRVSIAFDR
ncbi:hypothetical protein LXL04_020498 [Taraxacum kok-saghyz]